MEATIQRGKKTPQEQYLYPILIILVKLNGSAETFMIRERLERSMRGVLNEFDYGYVPSGEVRWWNTACWARKDLKEMGYLRSNSPHGVWEISEEGRLFLVDALSTLLKKKTGEKGQQK